MYRLKRRLKMAKAIEISRENARNCRAAGLNEAKRASRPRKETASV
jgi:hypothetical protein